MEWFMSSDKTPPRLAIVTGGGTGIGLGAAECLARSNFSVLLVGRRLDKLEAAANKIGPLASVFAGDITRESDVDRLVDTVRERGVPLHALVNNAGAEPLPNKGKLRTSSEAFDHIIGVNLKATYFVIAAMEDLLLQPGGCIVNVTSIGPYTGSGGPIYAASKAGVHGMTTALAKQLGPRGITVNVVAPGFVHTDMTASVPAEHLTAVTDSIPLGRPGLPAEIGEAIAFLCSPASSYINGQILAVCGGKTLGR
jgi:3-oxoacyl-[acyl-carrier protein] reductase